MVKTFSKPVNSTIQTSITLWLFNIAMENGPFIDDFPIKTSIYKGFSMAMLNNQMVGFGSSPQLWLKPVLSSTNPVLPCFFCWLSLAKNHLYRGPTMPGAHTLW